MADGQELITNSESQDGQTRNIEQAVLRRYQKAARALEPELCLPVDYDRSHLAVIPDEIIAKDYGCGPGSACCP
jgi:arsenite methyltransferase